MAKKYKLILLKCTVCNNQNYVYTVGTKGPAKKKLNLSKHCKFCLKHEPHVEAKV